VGRIPRVAFFTDTFEEINGVALTSRQLTDFARRRDYPFLCVRGGPEMREYVEGQIRHVELKRGALAFELDKGLQQDPMLWMQAPRIGQMLEEFQPDIVHIVSPGDVSLLGLQLAKQMKLPLAISWHTNLHDFGAMRLDKAISWAPDPARESVASATSQAILSIVLAFYKLGDVLYAPNDELVQMIAERTGKPVFLMKRGIDTELYNPARRTVNDGVLRLGYVGRITPEKSVRFLKELETGLQQAGVPPFKFTVIGDGSELDWLRENLLSAELPGIKRGQDLANWYANMDVFVFPSRTDTFGNVVLEAFASGVPAVVTDAGGPKFIVCDGISGYVAASGGEFIERTVRLLRDADLRRKMAEAARQQACSESWDTVFDKVYEAYLTGIAARAAVDGGDRAA
jgi:glycosyltransferase involved in cell wall biosynthesis